MKAVRTSFFGSDVETRKHPALPVWCSVDGDIIHVPCKNNKTYRLTKGRLTPHGYLTVSVGDKPYFAHRLVAETFLENTDNKPTVDHINRVRTDNRVRNLRWATHSEQRENSSQVLDATDYGVRSCEDKKAYNNAEAKDWYKRHKEYRKEYMRNYYLTHKEKWGIA